MKTRLESAELIYEGDNAIIRVTVLNPGRFIDGSRGSFVVAVRDLLLFGSDSEDLMGETRKATHNKERLDE